MSMPLSRLSIVALLMVSWGCASTTPAHDDLPRWSINERPILDIGDDAAGIVESAGDVNGATRLPDGRIIVADRQSSSLTFFAANGTLEKRVGRAGRGPGEFVHLSHLMRCGDSLLVYDSGKYSVYSLDGVLHRQFTLAGPSPGERAYRTACNSTGVLLSYGWDLLKNLPRQSSVVRTTVPYWLSRSDGTLLATLGRFWSSERWASIGDKVSGTGPLPLGKQPVVAVGRSRAYVGFADSLAVEVFTLDGVRASTIRRDGPVRKSTSADIERFKLLDTLGRSQVDNERTVEEWREMQFPQTLPAYSSMVVDSDDNLWIRLYPEASETRATWIGFTSDGAGLAQVALPLALIVTEIGRDYVLGTEAELQTGIKRVKVFALIRGAPAPSTP